MKKATGFKLISGLTGTAALLSGCAATGPEDANLPSMPTEEAAIGEQASLEGLELRQQEVYNKIANVRGEFSFAQDELTPPDEVFNLFGTAATYACAKPGFAMDEVDHEEYYVNISGNIKKVYSISLEEIKKQQPENRNMVCTCASGSAIINTRVTGISVSDVINLAELEDGVNTITFKDSTGYGLPLPLSYVLEKDALLVYQVGGMDLPASQGAPLQVWMPDTVAKYFTRQVTEIELTAEEQEPEVAGMPDEFRAKVNVVNRFDRTFAVGDQIIFEGYADDCGTAITAVEFSLDGGETWTVCDTPDAVGDQWVYWHFAYTTEEAGTFKLDVRARTEDGTVSPLASSVVFTVTEIPEEEV